VDDKIAVSVTRGATNALQDITGLHEMPVGMPLHRKKAVFVRAAANRRLLLENTAWFCPSHRILAYGMLASLSEIIKMQGLPNSSHRN
jgi:hypothetical protein